jgi:hypothetical protein
MKTHFLQSSKKIFGFMIGLMAFALNGMSQTGAGGVGNSSTNKLWLDANTLGLSNGAGVSSFEDVSLNGNTFTQTNSSNQPVYTTSGLNGLPVVTFDGVNDYMSRGATSGLETSAITVFVVYKKASLKAQTLINAGYTGELDKWILYSNSGNDRMNSKHKSPTNKIVYYNDSNTPTIVSAHLNSSHSRTYENGVLMQNSSASYIAESGNNLIRIGAYNYNLTGSFLEGFIAEMVVFNTQLNDLERIMVENYLGNKYGFTIPTDRYSHESTHNIGIIGIGDDGSDSQSSAKGAGVVQISNPASMTSGDYLLCGHTNVDLTDFTTTDLPGSLPTHQRFTRTWRVDETNDVGTTDIIFDLSNGQDNFGASTSYRLLVDTDGNFTDASVHTGTYNGGAQTMTFSVDLNDNEFFTLAGIEQELIIESTNVTQNWSLTTTWDCGCIPTSSDEVYIMPGHTVNVDIDASAKYLSIDGTLNMNDDVTLSNFGDLDMTVPVTFNNGTFALVGSADQYIDPAGESFTFNNLTINNSAGSNLDFFEGTYILNGLMDPINGAMIVAGAPGEFIVNSTSASTGGRIGKMESGFSASGLFTVRRFIPAGSADWRDLASPVIGAKFAVWDPDLEISCPDCPDGTACGNGSCFNSINYYLNTSSIDILSINDVIENGRGYEVFCGDDLTSFSGTTLNTTGTLNTSGSIVNTVSSNWQTMGNPYACPIDFDEITFSGVGKYYYVYNTTSGGYEYYDNNTTSGSIPEIDNGLVASGQGMWMNGPGTITFTQDTKVLTDDGNYIKSNTVDKSLHFALTENSSTYNCVASLLTSNLGSNSLDEYDVKHLERDGQKAPAFSFIHDETYIRKDYIEKGIEDRLFPMHLLIQNEGYHTISCSNFEEFNKYAHIYLIDNQTGDIVDFKEESSYVFFGYEGLNDERFTIALSNSTANDEIFNPSASVYDITNDISISQISNLVNVTNSGTYSKEVSVSLVNVLGQKEVYTDVLTLNSGSNLITLPTDLSGMHIMTLFIDGKQISKKLVF